MAEDPREASNIFISYRREDTLAPVNGLFPQLREHFGKGRVFKDVDAIPIGRDFREVIENKLKVCSVFLAMIGKNWLTAKNPKTGARRIDDPNDYLHFEIASALKREDLVFVPVLVGQATMPGVEDLPKELSELAYRNAFKLCELSDERWDADVRRLIVDIESAGHKTAPQIVPPVAVADPDTSTDTFIERGHRRRERQIAENLATAREAFEAHDYDTVLHACDEVVLLNPDHTEARDLWRRARTALDEQRIGDWLAQAREAMAGAGSDGQLSMVSGLIDQALVLQPAHAAALQLRQELLAIRKQRERQREIDRQVHVALMRARTSLEEDAFDTALEHCDDALALDPESAAARQLKQTAEAAKAEHLRLRELKRRAQKAIEMARARFESDPEQAIEQLEQFGPSHELVAPAITDLRARLQTVIKGRQERADQEARAAAVRALQERTANVQQMMTAARASLAAQQFDESLARLAEADTLARTPDPIEPLLRDIQIVRAAAESRKADRLRAIAAAVERAQASFDRSDYVATLRYADEALAIDATVTDALHLKQRATAALEEQRRLEEAAQELQRRREAAALEEQRQREAAALEEQRQREEAARLRAQAIASAVSSAQASFDRGDFEAAIGFAGKALALDSANTAAVALKERAAEAIAERERRAAAARTVAAAIERAQMCCERGEYEAAIQFTDQALALDAQSTTAHDVKQQAIAALAERREREQREREQQEEAERQRIAAAQAREEKRQAEAKAREDQRRAEAKAREERRQAAARAREEEERRQAEAAAAVRQAAAAAAMQADANGETVASPMPVSVIDVFKPIETPLEGGRGFAVKAAAAVAIGAVALTALWFALRQPESTDPVVVDPPAPTVVEIPRPVTLPPPSGQTEPPPTAPVARGTGPAPAAPASIENGGRGRQGGGLENDVARQIQQLRETADRLYRDRDTARALTTVVNGLRLAPTDAGLMSTLRSLENDALSTVQRARQDATAVQAASRAAAQMKQATQQETDAAALRNANRTEDAIKALWTAAETYSAAAERGRQIGVQLDGLVARARAQLRDGQRPQALTTAIEGLKIEPTYAPLNDVVNDIWRDAQNDAARSKQQAAQRGVTPASKEFEEALQREAAATKLRDKDVPEAVRSLWAARDLFAKSAPPAVAAARPEPPAVTPPAAAVTPPAQLARQAAAVARPSIEDEIRPVLQRYVAAYNGMDAAALAALQPSFSREQWDRTFSQFRSYSMAVVSEQIVPSGNEVTVNWTVELEIRPRVGETQNRTLSTTLRLQRSGTSWIVASRK